MRMYGVPLAVWLMLVAPQTAAHLPRSFDERFRLQPETAAISRGFAADAWATLVYVTRQSAAGTATLQSARDADASLAKLKGRAASDGEWLLWLRLNNYSIAKLVDAARGKGGPQPMRDPEACRSALIAINRMRVMPAVLPACDMTQRPGATRTP